jgi:hypothetical protein
MKTQDPLARRLSKEPRLAALGSVAVEASAVSGSPYDYVHVFFSEEDLEGPHLTLSDLREYEERDGVIVGAYRTYDEEVGGLEDYPTVDAAVEAAERLAAELLS